MGTCHSSQPKVVIADNKPRKPAVECCKGSGTPAVDPAVCHNFSMHIIDSIYCFDEFVTVDQPIDPRLDQTSVDPGTDASSTPSLTSYVNGMTRESSEIVDGGCQAHHHLESQPIAEESFPAIISDVPLPPQVESVSLCPLKASRHKRNESLGLVKDYLQAEGASSNRIMIQIEVGES